MKKFKKVILISGTSSGIGKYLAVKLSQNNTVIGFSRGKSNIKNKNYYHHRLDINKNKKLETLIKNIMTKHKKIDILINNAGINKINEVNRINNNDWDEINKVNLRAPYLMTKLVSKIMIKQKKGYIINISSIFGVISKEKRAAYSASKSGLIGLTKASAIDLAKYNILVNSVSPGFVETELTKKILSIKDKVLLKKNVPLKRFAKKEEVTNLLFFLCSKYNTYITGQNIIIDGGFTLK